MTGFKNQTANKKSRKRQDDPVTIVVFPFENLVTEGKSDLFCASFCLDLITELSKFRQFQIISLQSLNNVRTENESLHRLGADYHILGSFRSDKTSIQVNAQLVDSHSLRMVWANRFKAPFEKMMDVQEDLLQEVLATLQEKLNYDLLSQFRRKERTQLNAYEYWLYGMAEVKKGSPENDEKAREYFQEAIRIDPEFSLAYSGMSLSYFNDWSCQLWEKWEINQNGAFEWAEKAIELDEYNYIAAAVLARIFLYKDAFETAEHYARRSLHLNNNDPATLIQNAVTLVYLGFAEEAGKWYDKAQRINPANAMNYHHVGIFILIMQERYKDALNLLLKTPHSPWIDADVFAATIHYHLGDLKAMDKHWQKFLMLYKKRISREKESTDEDAIDWFLNVNPFRYNSPLTPLMETVSNRNLNREDYTTKTESGSGKGVFIQSGELWEMTFAGDTVTLPEVKGFHDLQVLLRAPHEPFHCAQLMDSVLTESGEDILDEKAKKAYQEKILSLQAEISSAEDNNDFHLSTELQKEYDELIEYLSGALGLGGRTRKKGSSIEKARSAVTWRIRSAISKIEKGHPRLGRHLANSIKTGTTCSYSPETTINWST